MVRPALAIAFLLALSASVDAETIHRSRLPRARLPSHELVAARPDQRFGTPGRFSVPGWSDAQTQHWLNSASAASGLY
jgi:hypothetical protein